MSAPNRSASNSFSSTGSGNARNKPKEESRLSSKPASKVAGGVGAKPTTAKAYDSRDGRDSRDTRESRDSRDGRGQMARGTDRNADPRNQKIAPRFLKGTGPQQAPSGRMTTSNVWDKNETATASDSEKSTTVGQPIVTAANIVKSDAKQILDGSSPPVNTIIFENTNYKAAGPAKRQTKEPIAILSDIIDKQQIEQQQQSLSSALQNMSFAKPNPDPEYYHFESEINQLTDDKTQVAASNVAAQMTKTLGGLPKHIHQSMQQNLQQNISPSTADLNMKIASCKKVWEEPPMAAVLEQQQHINSDQNSMQFVSQQQQVHQQYSNMSAMTHHQHTLSPGPQGYSFVGQQGQHQSGQSGELEHDNGQNHMQQHSQQNLQGLKGADAFGTNANVCKVKPTQQQLHQSGLGVSPPPQMQQTYYQPTQSFPNLPAIPSPPAVVFNSTLQQSPAPGLYSPYQTMEPARATMAHYGYHAGSAGNTSYNNYMQQPQPQHENMYQNMTQFRGTVQQQQGQPFAQAQQNNQSTVLISSTANSLMSASVKATNHGAIGSKSTQAPTGASQAYGQYMNVYHPQQQHPIPNNSYYTNSTATQPNHYYGNQATAGVNSQNYGLQTAGMFGAPTNGPPQQQQMPSNPYNSQPYLSSQLMNSLVAMNQYRGAPNVAGNGNGGNAPAGYMKQNQQQSHMQDPVSSTTFFKNNV